MFIKNKYYRWYYQIIDKARKRGVPDEYYEGHHILPRCMGGTNDWWNLVSLTYREHFLAHWLLTKCVKGFSLKRKMNFAFASMTKMSSSGKFRVSKTSWQYKRAKV